MLARGARSIIGIGRVFKIMDDNNSRSLDKYEFTKAMTDYMLGFSEGEIQRLFAYFDFDRSGLIEFDEFIRAIRGPMNNNRKRIVGQAFNKYCIDPSTRPNALIICCITPSVTTPATMAGAKNTYADRTFACRYAIRPTLKYR